MKKQIVKKIIKGAIIFGFVMFFMNFFSLSQAYAAKLDYDNPNKSSGSNPYRFKTSDYLNSDLIMQVVGCSGKLDKISNSIANFAMDLTTEEGRKEIKTKVCSINKKVSVISGVVIGSATTGGGYQEIAKLMQCGEVTQTENSTQEEIELERLRIAQEEKEREECFNGIAITLARNQLTSMTRYTMNWVNTGFNGDPMYIRDITSFTNNLERNVLETGINILTSPNEAYPYGSDFSRSAIYGYNSGGSFRSGNGNFLSSLTSDLGNFITDPKGYYSDSALERAKNINNVFSDDFSSGGWNGWLALTQRDQNNPLGFTIQASQSLEDQQTTEIENTKEEIATNNGFFSQKKCVLWNVIDEDGLHIFNDNAYGFETTTSPDENDECAKEEVVTPGSLIKDKVSTYTTSGERQLELADTINEALNSLFTALLTRFQDQGLASLSSEDYVYSDPNMGVGSDYNNSTDDMGYGSDSINNGSGGYRNGSFDITRDLGNTYIHNYGKSKGSLLGTWNAKINDTNASGTLGSNLSRQELNIGVAPVRVDDDGNSIPLINVWYDVSVAGNTKLFNNGYNGWAVGDRAFWDGTNWQNWKAGMTNPIKKRGIIQIQKDYQVAAKEMLKILPSIMPKVGELDYCIPGPNPNWEISSGEAQGAFTDLTGTMEAKEVTRWRCPRWSTPIPLLFSPYYQTQFSCINPLLGGVLGIRSPEQYAEGYTITPAGPGTEEYDNYFSIFKKTLNSWWDAVKNSTYWDSLSDDYNMGTNYFEIWNDDEADEIRAQKIIDAAVRKLTNDVKVFYKVYGDYIDNRYGANGDMQKEFLESENTSVQIPNPDYLPMASEGLDITKDIISYDSDITEITEGYKNDIIEASSNISKLTTIKNSVSAIIKAAQTRRDARLMSELGLTYDEYRRRYAACIEEEDILYEDYNIINGGGDEALRCYDDIDNDLDGLIDNLDPDCSTLSASYN